MKNTLRFSFLIVLISIFSGFYVRDFKKNEILGEKIIGSGVLFLVIILIPIFLYYRWKGKDIRDYTLTDENFNKMKEITQKKKNY
tara:strand:- start:351 stop:605 length:255 start_codon:yes stop_codon:yes gene_type:complete